MKISKELPYCKSGIGRDIIFTSRISHNPQKQKRQTTYLEAIATVAAANLSSLLDYQIDAHSLAIFEAAITSAKTLTITRDAVGNTGQAATKGIGDAVTNSVHIFENLDALIESMLTDDDKAFEDAYLAARKVDYHKGGSKHAGPLVPVV